MGEGRRPRGRTGGHGFHSRDGEPKNTQAVYDKLKALGESNCQNGEVRRGAAFGNYEAQPNDGFYIQFNQSREAQRFYSIVDDPKDWDGDMKTVITSF